MTRIPKRGETATDQERMQAIFMQAGVVQPPEALTDSAPSLLRRFGHWIAAYPFLSAGLALAAAISAKQIYRASHPINVAENFSGPLNEAITLTVNVQDLDLGQATQAKIHLEAGLSFVSDKYAQIQNAQDASLKVEASVRQTGLPLWIRGTEIGSHAVNIQFVDSAGAVVADRKLEVQITSQK